MMSRRERYEARFNAMNLAKRGDYELYSGMINRLEQALEAGDIDDVDDSIKSTRERAHILLHRATSNLTAASSKPTSSSSSHSRQQAADWAKANAAAMEPRGGNRSIRLIKRSNQDEHGTSDESVTEHEINTTRALLEEAAARLSSGGTNLEAGVNNVIYEKLVHELGLNTKNKTKSPCIIKSTKDFQNQQEESNSPSSLRARREYAASVLSETRLKESTTTTLPSPLSLPNPLAAQARLQRRHSAMEILKNLKEKQPHTSSPIRRSSISCQGVSDNLKQQQPSSSSASGSAARAMQSMLSAAQIKAAGKPLPISKRSISHCEPQQSSASREKTDPKILRSSKERSSSKKKTKQTSKGSHPSIST